MSLGTPTSTRISLAHAQLQGCDLCEHRCGANRLAGERGPCKAGPDARVFRHRVECGEEADEVEKIETV